MMVIWYNRESFSSCLPSCLVSSVLLIEGLTSLAKGPKACWLYFMGKLGSQLRFVYCFGDVSWKKVISLFQH